MNYQSSENTLLNQISNIIVKHCRTLSDTVCVRGRLPLTIDSTQLRTSSLLVLLSCSISLFLFLILSPLERFDPHPLYHHFVKASFNRSHHTRDSSLTVTPDMPHAKSAITHHFGIGIGLAFRHSGPALVCALGCLRFYSCFAPAVPVFLPACELFSR